VSIPDRFPESYPAAASNGFLRSNEGAPPEAAIPPAQLPVDLNEAARQLELAIHDARVAFDCTGLANLDRAHTFAITARAAIDSAEHLLRAALTAPAVIQPDLDRLAEEFGDAPTPPVAS
jgi:hypothetical protein